MPSIASSVVSLPHIDVEPSVEAIAAADALIKEEMSGQDVGILHHSIQATSGTHSSHDTIEERPRMDTIDLTRYEALDAPATGDLTGWRETLQKAYTSAEYMRGRETNLSLLETYGKNAWLIGNSQLEDILRDLERDLEAATREQEAVRNARKARQDAAAGELQGLENAWQKGIGRMLETQAAAEGLRQEILLRKRQKITQSS